MTSTRGLTARPVAARSRKTRRLAHFDFALAVATVLIAAFGGLMVYSATRVHLRDLGADPYLYLKRQFVWAAVGLAVMLLIASLDYRRVTVAAAPAYIGLVLLLLAVMSPLGAAAKGSQRWFALGPFQLQPSAFAGVVCVVVLAAYFHRRRDGISLGELGASLGLLAVPMGLVAVQPDLGTAIVMGAVGLTVLIVTGVRARWLAVLLLVAVVGVVGVLRSGTLKQYQTQRLTAFLDQSGDSNEATYNLNQSKIAIGSGGLVGRGLFNGTQTNLAFVPEQRTDFIFTAVGEQLGFVGSAGLLTLFAFILFRVWRAATIAKDRLGALLCTGVVGLLMVQIFENAGMTMGIVPITGIPLPFMSYGGSSTIAMFAAIGIVESVHARRFD